MADPTLLYQGAEAKIITSTYLGYACVCKQRIQKTYRHKTIDSMLRASRTKEEAKLMIQARGTGVSVPILYDIDIKQATITMEYCQGKRVKDIIDNLSTEQQKDLCVNIGKNIALLHSHDIIHGDLTTSNMLYEKSTVTFIDFGLGQISQETETKAVDLHVLMEAFSSTHSQLSFCFTEVCKGYKKHYVGNARQVFSTIEDIVRRGRYR